MNPKPILGLPDLEYWHIPTHTNMGIPIPIWGPHFECRFNLGISSVGPQIGMNPVLEWVSDWTIPKPIRGFVLVWGYLDPHFGSGIPESVWGFIVLYIPILVRGSPFWYGDSGFPVLVWGSPNRFWDSQTNMGILATRIPILVWGSPDQNGDPQTKMGCLLILSHSVQWWDLIYLSTDLNHSWLLLYSSLLHFKPFVTTPPCCSRFSPFSHSLVHRLYPGWLVFFDFSIPRWLQPSQKQLKLIIW